jgi:tetratricopeptide (TPR) repeat protein/tRNA A-37 threonylcarbamoyl transferase component Bud32
VKPARGGEEPRGASDEARVQALVEEALDSVRSPEEVCRAAPELLAAVRSRLARLRRVEAEVEALFPGGGPAGARESPSTPGETLPRIPGHAVESELARGGMGVVYRARHLKLGRVVAIKMLLAGEYASPRELARFLEEARAVANLCHPNIVHVFDVGELGGRPYFTMEYVAGGTLAHLLAGRPLAAASAVEQTVLLARAVEFAHASGIVHRDLKPANVLLTPEGTPKIADFGLARRLSDGASASASAAIGTPSYMAPEQVRGSTQGAGPTVDVYALGAILYEMLTGRPPFRSESALATQVAVLTSDPVPPTRLVPRVPRDLETICLKCLSKEVARRYSSAAELADDLGRFQRGEPIVARPAGALERGVRWVRRNPSRAALVVTGLALVALASIMGVREWTAMARERSQLESWSARLVTIRELQAEGRFVEAHAALARVPRSASPELRARIARAEAELELVERLEALRFGRGQTGRTDRYDPQADAQYAAIFTAAGLAVFAEPPERVAERIATSDVRRALVAALDDWALCVAERERVARLLEVARRADPDPWRDRVRDPGTWEDPTALAELARSVAPAQQPTSLLRIVGGLLSSSDDALAFLRRVQRAHPGDFWVNFDLGERLASGEEAIGYYRAALAVRPDALAICTNLAIALEHAGQDEEAGYLWQRTLELAPDSAITHYNVACFHQARLRADLAVVHAQRALQLDANHPLAHGVLGHALLELGHFQEAVAALQAASQRLPEGTLEGRAARAELAEAERMLALAPHCAAVLEGAAEPASAAERLQLARFAHRTGRHAAAAGLYAQAFAETPALAEQGGHRYDAARAAARAGQGPGVDAGEPDDRTTWRGEALQWLWAELAARAAELEGGTPAVRASVAGALARWAADPDLAALRDPEDLTGMTEEEREECRSFWNEVAALREQAR